MHQQSSEYVWTTPRWGCRVLEGMPPCLQGGPRRGGPRRGRSGKKLTLPLIAFGLSLSCTGAPMFIGRIYFSAALLEADPPTGIDFFTGQPVSERIIRGRSPFWGAGADRILR